MKLHFSLSLIMLLILAQYGIFSRKKDMVGMIVIKIYVIAIEKVSRHPLK